VEETKKKLANQEMTGADALSAQACRLDDKTAVAAISLTMHEIRMASKCIHALT
jgi:hypothetical protein